jgi:molybdopterin-guanine dinucleotide biosynthesis protein A
MRDCTLAILAGGEGSRMGKPKGLLTVGQLSILEYLLERFRWSGATMLVTAPSREHPPGWEQFDREFVDTVAGLGPLRGVVTALEKAETPIVVFATVDMPGVTSRQLNWFADELNADSDAVGLMTRRVTVDGEQIEPFPCAMRVAVQDVVRARLAPGLRSVYSLKEVDGFRVVPAPVDWPESSWTNLNDPKDYAAFLRSHDGQASE